MVASIGGQFATRTNEVTAVLYKGVAFGQILFALVGSSAPITPGTNRDRTDGGGDREARQLARPLWCLPFAFDTRVMSFHKLSQRAG